MSYSVSLHKIIHILQHCLHRQSSLDLASDARQRLLGPLRIFVLFTQLISRFKLLFRELFQLLNRLSFLFVVKAVDVLEMFGILLILLAGITVPVLWNVTVQIWLCLFRRRLLAELLFERLQIISGTLLIIKMCTIFVIFAQASIADGDIFDFTITILKRK